MKVQILGTGCAKCKQLAENAQKAIEAAGVDAEIEKITDIAEIAAMGAMMTPALAIDGEVKSSGQVLTPEQIGGLLVG